ncbi:hypothetical protein AC249_AIPGENE605 [Exaiptasia diaphana]|nr:hypothetical protein AC249_AIPGENE605 [Exaiptasia diaphana]
MQVSKYNMSAEVTVTCCYAMLVPALVSPFVFYTLHVDLREVVNKSFKALFIKVKQNRHNTPRVVQSSVNQVMELEAKL